MHKQGQFTSKLRHKEREYVSNTNLCQAYDLGLVEYEKALQLQNNLVQTRLAGEIPDITIFLQHPSVLTIGLSGSEENVITSNELLTSEGIRVLHVDRGGDITYHGPGQLVGYLIFDLTTKGRDIHQFMHNLEEVVINTLDAFSIFAYHDSQYPGVWVGQAKICALGIRVTHWVTKHGFALNVNTDLSHFSYINPCGITDREVTSMSQLLGHDVAMDDVTSCLLEQYARIFNITIRRTSTEELNYYYTE
ncbi:lipoyl(octanoyl) transferase LipB [Chloroflexota bacterium]